MPANYYEQVPGLRKSLANKIINSTPTTALSRGFSNMINNATLSGSSSTPSPLTAAASAAANGLANLARNAVNSATPGGGEGSDSDDADDNSNGNNNGNANGNGGYGGNGGSGSGGNDEAADRQNRVAEYNARSLQQQLGDQLASYALADEQNRNLRDVQSLQGRIKDETDRFQANRDLQNAAVGLYGVLGPAGNSSSVYNLMRMLENRNDSDNVTYWQQAQQNRDTVNNAYEESVNQNQVARLEALANAQKGMRDLQADLSANLQGLGSEYYQEPGSNPEIAEIERALAQQASAITANNPRLSGYIMPDNSVQAARDLSPRNRLAGNDYFSRLINGFNGRR